MDVMRFRDRLKQAIEGSNTLLCVGLDTDLDRLPAGVRRTPEGVLEFNMKVIRATLPHTAGYKLNSAFYEAMGHQGAWVLQQTRRMIPKEKIAILDAKRGDIGNSSRKYAYSVFDVMDFDAVTVSPYLGRDSILPFLSRPDRGAFVLTRTSNPTSDEIQTARAGAVPLFVSIARMVAEIEEGNGGLVVGATQPEAFNEIREVAPDLPLLVPGVGKQGGGLEAPIKAHFSGPVLINSSRGIIYASSGEDYAEAAGIAAAELTARMHKKMGVS